MDFTKFKYDKFLMVILFLIIALGIFIRLNDASLVGYWNDDMTTIPTGLLFFYPYELYPGLAGQGEPILGNIIIAAGCMLSGEDFSKVSEVKPMFYPGRETLIGEELIKAFPYCHLPMYLFSILFFLTICLFSINLLDKYSSIFAISFYAFYPEILKFSRWIHVDIFGYFFVALGLLFLWWAYNSEKTRKEILLFIVSFTSFALAFTTKLPNGMFIVFAVFILLEKYSKEFFDILKKIGSKLNLEFVKRIKENEEINCSRLINILVYSILSYLIVFLAVFYFNPKNFFNIINKYQSIETSYSTLAFNTEIFDMISEFFLLVNILDVILVIFSLWIFFKLIANKERNNNEKFILYLLLFLILSIIITKALNFPRVLVAFLFGLIFLMSLAFSEKYSIFKIFRVKNIRVYNIGFLIIYIIFSFSIAFYSSPHFSNRNFIFCRFSEVGCDPPDIAGFAQKDVANYFNDILKENETFLSTGLIIHYYVRRNQHLQEFLFDQFFSNKVGRRPTLIEKIEYFHPDNQTIRYVAIRPNKFRTEDELIINLRKDFIPNKTIKLKKTDAVWIYDLQNLNKRQI